MTKNVLHLTDGEKEGEGNDGNISSVSGVTQEKDEGLVQMNKTTAEEVKEESREMSEL